MPSVKISEMPPIGNALIATAIIPIVESGINYTVTAANLQTFVNTSAGNITAANFVGSGAGLTNIPGANVSGSVANATYAATAGTATTATNAANATHANIADLANVASVAYSVAAANVVGTVANAAYATAAGTAAAATTAVTVTASAQPNIASVGTLTSLAVTGNATIGNVGTTNLAAIGLISTTGNVAGNYILGNGSLLTGLPATYGNANVATYLASGTNSSNIITTGNISGSYVLGNGAFLTGISGGSGNYSNSNVVSLMSNFGSNTISTTGNITGGYFVGNGSALTGIVASAGSYISNGNLYANVAAANGKVVINGGGTVANAAMIAAAPSNTVMLFNDVGNAYIRLDATGNIYIGNNPNNPRTTHILQPTLMSFVEFTDNNLPGGNSNISGSTLNWGRSTTANFNGNFKVPVYTVAGKPTVGQFVGYVISIQDSPTNTGKLAYWCGNNNRWQYVKDDSPV